MLLLLVFYTICLLDGKDVDEFLDQGEEVEVNNFQNILRDDGGAEVKREQLIQQLFAERSH